MFRLDGKTGLVIESNDALDRLYGAPLLNSKLQEPLLDFQ